MSAAGSSSSERARTAASATAITIHYALPGLIGSVLLFIGSLGVGWVPPGSKLLAASFIGLLRSSTLGPVFSRAAVFVGVALILQAWLVLGHDVLDGVECSCRRLITILAVWAAPLLVMPPLFSRDAFSYYAQGQLMIAGLNPYVNTVSELPGWFRWGADPLWAESPVPYGPAFLLLSHGVAATTDRAFMGMFMFRGLAVLGVALLAWAVPRLAAAHGIDAPKALWLAVLNPLVLMHFVAGAHNDSLMVGLMVAGMALAVAGRPAPGVALIGLAGAIKPSALLILPFAGLLWAGMEASWRARIWAWVRSAGIVAALFLGLSWLAGVGLGWVATLGTPGSVRTWLSPPTALGMITGTLLDWVGLGTVDGAVSFFRGLAMAIGAVIGLYLVLNPTGRSPVRGAALGLLAVVVLSPVLQPWYLLWVLPLLAATGLTGAQLRTAMLITAALILHGMAESNATADTLVDFRDGLASLLALGIIALVLASSPGERRLILGDPVDRGLRPQTPAARRAAGSLVFQGTAKGA
ncbi:MAG: polyprenol phosphomannose-dependent alpha 1,6 mannosyltransferase MptB [Candidatus Nanopelagicales bacterium]